MKIPPLTIPLLLVLSACTFSIRPAPENVVPTPLPATPTPERALPCAAENWEIAIVSISQVDLSDGTKLFLAKLGIENNDSLWGSVKGPANEPRQNVFLTTKDGSTYEPIDSSNLISLEQLSEPDQIMLAKTGQIETPLMPPGFVTLGKIIDGEPYYHNFAFLIPDSQELDRITIGGMEVECIYPRNAGDIGKPVRRHKTIQLPVKTHNLETEITDVRETPSSRRYPNLVGAELVTSDWKETIAITNVTRNGTTIVVTFDFTNFSSHPMSPAFNGYIMGSSRFFICQKDCKGQKIHEPVGAGQTAQDLIWTFTLPEDETNLVFVYAYGGNIDLNEVYRINLE